jgi:NAD(P)-dependent dehydrogenase (short-subunit alcohol dehydrogenase family)
MKSALVTGANKGIGFEVAKILAQKGIFVYQFGKR